LDEVKRLDEEDKKAKPHTDADDVLMSFISKNGIIRPLTT
jgi:hypothetical protein